MRVSEQFFEKSSSPSTRGFDPAPSRQQVINPRMDLTILHVQRSTPTTQFVLYIRRASLPHKDYGQALAPNQVASRAANSKLTPRPRPPSSRPRIATAQPAKRSTPRRRVSRASQLHM